MALVYESGKYVLKDAVRRTTIDLACVSLGRTSLRCALPCGGKLIWCDGEEVFQLRSNVIEKIGEITFDAHVMYATAYHVYIIGSDKIARMNVDSFTIEEYDNPTGSSDCVVIDGSEESDSASYVIHGTQCFELGGSKPVTNPTMLFYRCMHDGPECIDIVPQCKHYLAIVWTGTELKVDQKGNRSREISGVTVYEDGVYSKTEVAFVDKYYRIYTLYTRVDCILAIEIGDNAALIHTTKGTRVAQHTSVSLMKCSDCTLDMPVNVKSSRKC